MLSLVGLAHGLVADLTVSVSVDWLVGAIVHGGNSGGDGGGQNRGVDSGVMSDGVNRSGVNSGVVDHWGSVDGVMGNWVDRSGVVGNRVDGVMSDGVDRGGVVDSVSHGWVGDRVGEVMGHSVDSVGGVDGGGERLAILVNRDWLGEEGVQKRVGIKGVQLRGRVAVNLETKGGYKDVIQLFMNLSYCIPGLASEEFLVKQSSVRTHESCSRRAVSSILAHAVSLHLL